MLLAGGEGGDAEQKRFGGLLREIDNKKHALLWVRRLLSDSHKRHANKMRVALKTTSHAIHANNSHPLCTITNNTRIHEPV